MKNTNFSIQALMFLASSMMFLSANHASAACSGNTTITTAVTSSQLNTSDLCSININSSGSIATSVSGGSGDGISNFGPMAQITTLNNNGSISTSGSSAYGIYNDGGGTITTLNNTGTISTSGNSIGIANGSTITTLNNTGTISSSGYGIYNYGGGTITTLNNIGTISTSNNSTFGIINYASITTLNNLQGVSGSALTFSGTLPNNYNIIIDSTTNFGKIAFSSPSGTTTLGISSLSGTNIGVAGTRYQDVISGLTATNITNEATTLTYTNGLLSATYQLVADDSSVANTWDLLILTMINGPSATDTQSSLHSLAPKLRGAFSGQTLSTNFANMNTYDCDLFDAKGVCVSVGGQQTYLDNPSSNMASTVVVAGYKVSPNIRIGGFLNQNINNNTVAGVHISNANPMMGLFAVWNQNEDRLGYQVKIANAYQDKDVTTTRDVIGTSEAGTGSTTLNTQSYVGELSYAFLANEDKTLVRPYAALRYTRIKQDGYSEQTSAGVTAPLTYSALADLSTTALVGVKLNHKLAEKVNLTGSLGFEQDLYHQVDNLTTIGLSGLTSENFNDSIKRTRPVASIGAYYMPVKNQRIAADLYYQQLPFQSTGSATAYVNYTIGF